MVVKCKECGQYRMHVDKNGICPICIKSREKDDLGIVVKGLEKMFNQLTREFRKLQIQLEKQNEQIDKLKESLRKRKNV